MRYFLLTMIISLSLFNIAAAKTLEIFAPEKRISIDVNHALIVGKTDAKIVDIFLNGKFFDNVLVVENFFHKQVNFGYGLHEIKVVPAYSGQSSSETDYITLEIMYAPLIERKYKRLYPDYSYHSNKVNSICLNCHELNYDSLNEVDNSKTCLDCHVSIKETFNKHTIGENKTCLMCHELGSDLKAIINEQDKESNPCYKCHDDKIKSFDQEYVHGPIAGGSCMICHSMHGSTNEHNLNMPEDELCFECHSDVEKQVNVQVVHKPFIEGKCGSCHNPHSTNNEWILNKSSQEICLSCHDPEGDLKDHIHPFNTAPKKEIQIDLELTEDGELECLTCHNPHSSKKPFMLKTDNNSICIGCHPDIL